MILSHWFFSFCLYFVIATIHTTKLKKMATRRNEMNVFSRTRISGTQTTAHGKRQIWGDITILSVESSHEYLALISALFFSLCHAVAVEYDKTTWRKLATMANHHFQLKFCITSKPRFESLNKIGHLEIEYRVQGKQICTNRF